MSIPSTSQSASKPAHHPPAPDLHHADEVSAAASIPPVFEDDPDTAAGPLVLASVSDREGHHAGDLFLDEDGITVITPLETILPGRRCAKCGRKTSHQVSRNLWWHHPALYAALLAGPILYAPLAWFRGERTTVDVHLCRKHRESHLISICGASALGAVALVMLVLGMVTLDWRVIATGLVMATGSIFWYRWSTLSAARIESGFVWIRGVSPDYVNKIHSEHA